MAALHINSCAQVLSNFESASTGRLAAILRHMTHERECNLNSNGVWYVFPCTVTAVAMLYKAFSQN